MKYSPVVPVILFSLTILEICASHTIHKRSFGGKFADITDYPYMASLRRAFGDHFCGGSIIGNSWILTASHCIMDENDPKYVSVVVGTNILQDKDELYHKVKSLHSHPNFTSSIRQLEHDIALVELEKPLEFSDTVKSVPLGRLKRDEVTPVVAAGWGRFKKGRAVSFGDKLRSLEMATMSTEPCAKIHEKKNNIVDGETQICATAGDGKSLCSGDSGAPLLDKRTMRQVGVFSGFETCTGEFPTLYARVESYIDWINDITNLKLKLE